MPQRADIHDASGNVMRKRDVTIRSYGMRASSVNVDARTVEAVMATENPVMVFDLREWRIVNEVLRMDGISYPDQVPLQDNHMMNSIKDTLGSTRNIHVEGGAKLVGTRHFGDKRDSLDAFGMVRDRHITDGSIGYMVKTYIDISPGESETVGGKHYSNDVGTLDLRITTKSAIHEDSLTPIGADVDAKMRHAMAPVVSLADVLRKAIDVLAEGDVVRELMLLDDMAAEANVYPENVYDIIDGKSRSSDYQTLASFADVLGIGIRNIEPFISRATGHTRKGSSI